MVAGDEYAGFTELRILLDDMHELDTKVASLNHWCASLERRMDSLLAHSTYLARRVDASAVVLAQHNSKYHH